MLSDLPGQINDFDKLLEVSFFYPNCLESVINLRKLILSFRVIQHTKFYSWSELLLLFKFYLFVHVMRCAIWYHLYNFKNVKSLHGGVLLLVLVKLQAY